MLPGIAKSQLRPSDSLRIAFINVPDGRLKYEAANRAYYYYQELNRDSALFYTEQQILNARQAGNSIAEGVASVSKSYQLMGLGRYAESLKCLQQAFAIAEDDKNEKAEPWQYFLTPFQGNNRLLLLSYTHHMYALLMLQTGNLEQQIIHFKIAGDIGKSINYTPRIMLAYLNLGQSYLTKQDPDSALYYEKQAEHAGLNADSKTFSLAKVYLGTVEHHLGDIYKALGNNTLSLSYYYKSLKTCWENNNHSSLSRVYLRLSRYHIENNNKDSALYYSIKNLQVLKTLGKVTGAETNLGVGYENLYLSYKLNNQFDSAFKYQGLALVTKDSLNKTRVKDLTEFQNASFQEVVRLQNLEKDGERYQNKIRIYALLVGLALFIIIALILYRNNRHKHRTNKVLQDTLADLKSTQAQLVHSEKMASLGELTAGIAHEIQNPLNFINNFSELNKELLAEMKQEAETGNMDEVKKLVDNLIANEEKINHHGIRADAIVKSMLQHSRISPSKKEATDINALAEEYLRLSYHGLKAKDKLFNANFTSELDHGIGAIQAIPQDIGRVLLNLYNNAFYSVNNKKKQLNGLFEPLVHVSTKQEGSKVVITIRDNGTGIPETVLSKIYQPFFTTKPTGEGTGLGLSLSYDIITKGHGGEMKVRTAEGEFAEFKIILPARSNEVHSN